MLKNIALSLVLVVLPYTTIAAEVRTAEITIESNTAMENSSQTDLSNLTLAQMKALFGDPSQESEFILTSDVLEFRIELLNFFTVDALQENPPNITELTWGLSAQRNKTIWFRDLDGDMKFLHQMDWHPDDEF